MAVLIASSDANGELFTASLADVAYAAWQAFTSRQDMSSVLLSYVNQAIVAAEEAQPEGAEIELSISGWVNPITGTDYSFQVADWINSQWQSGNVVGAGGEPIIPWAEYPNQVAWGLGNMVVMRWTKGMVQVIVFLGLVAACLVALAIIASIVGKWLSPWTMTSSVGTVRQPTWWDKLSPWEKIMIISGGFLVGLFGVWFLASKSIAEAGAPQVIVTGGGYEYGG
jgi:hypothetical protein